MFPLICTIGPIRLHSYGLMFALASLTCIFFVVREGKREGLESDIFYDLYFWILIAALVGARLLYVLTNLEIYLSDPLGVIKIYQGGLSWFGGFIFGLGAALIFIKRQRLSFLRIADIFAPYLALAQAIGRIGCFLNGCCYGKPSQSWFALNFPGHLGSIHPTQAYSFFGLILIFIILTFIKRREKENMAGKIFCLYLLFSGLNRFIIEFFRADTIPTPVFNLSLFQVFSSLLIFGSIFFFLVLKNRLPKD